MKLTSNLKAKVEHTGSREEAKKAIADAGMLLNDEELDQVAGGDCGTTLPNPGFDEQPKHTCSCGWPQFYKSGRGWICPKCDQ